MRWTYSKIHLTVISIICFLLLSSAVLAESTVSSEAISNSINPQEAAEFTLSITNEEAFSQSYTIYSFSSGQGWSVDPSPLSDKVIENVAPGETYETTIVARTLESMDPGIYYVTIQVDSDNGESYELPLKIYLASEEDVDYLPAISVEIDMDEKIEPSQSQSVLIHVENRNPLNLSEMELSIQSELEEFNTQMAVRLQPLASKTLEFTTKIDAFRQPKDYSVFFIFSLGEEIVKIEEVNVEVISSADIFDYEVSEEKVFLKTFQEFIVTNNGNVENAQNFNYPVSLFSALFVKSDADIVKIDGQNYLSWELNLEPGEATYLNVVYNYRILFYVAIIFLLFLLFYFYVRSPISISKGAVTTTNNEGALQEIKIALDIKNKSNKTVTDITITDTIPGIANLEKSLDLGTVRPESVVAGKQGSKVIWKLTELEPLEHRIITYKLRTKLNVLGAFKLPRTVVEFSKKKGKTQKAYSNLFRLDASKIENQ